MTHSAEEPSEAADPTGSSAEEPTVGDAPNPMERGRSEDPPPDGVGYDGSPVEEIQADRAERLAPENRPENSEVDNSGRVFDERKAMFTDEEGYEDAPEKFPSASEQGA